MGAVRTKFRAKSANGAFGAAIATHGQDEFQCDRNGGTIVRQGGISFVADYRNWPGALDTSAAVHREASYFQVDSGPFDAFDNIRVALFQGRSDNAIAMAFSPWFEEWTGPAIVPIGRTQVSWHAYIFIDWVRLNGVPYLVAQNSLGSAWGDNGVQYFPREVVNAAFKISGTGCYMFRRLDPNDVKSVMDWKWAFTMFYRELIQRGRYIFGL